MVPYGIDSLGISDGYAQGPGSLTSVGIILYILYPVHWLLATLNWLRPAEPWSYPDLHPHHPPAALEKS